MLDFKLILSNYYWIDWNWLDLSLFPTLVKSILQLLNSKHALSQKITKKLLLSTPLSSISIPLPLADRNAIKNNQQIESKVQTIEPATGT